MSDWKGSLSRADAIRIFEKATDHDDPHWDYLVEDWYNEDSDTMPSMYHVLAAIGVTEDEYREIHPDANINWPQQSVLMNSIHTCSYHCNRPECIKAQRDELRDSLAAAEADAGRYQDVLQKIQSWCEAYPLDVFPEPDWSEVKDKLGAKLLSRVSASNMRHVVLGVKKLCDDAALQATAQEDQ
tara:strand:- start:4112 stop:4663 length:552 start_codon:yes stop_codon:yes gene_type:complete